MMLSYCRVSTAEQAADEGMKWKCAICRKKFVLSSSQMMKYKYATRREFVCSLSCRGHLISKKRRTTRGQQPIHPAIMARKKVLQAIQNGTLVRPSKCEACGNNPGLNGAGRSLLHAHHYAGSHKPLVVQWLCPPCHSKADLGRQHRGELSVNAKLTVAAVRRIRKGGSTAAFMREFGVAKATIVRARNKRTWAHVS